MTGLGKFGVLLRRRAVMIAAAVAFGSGGLAGCNTVAGIGDDLAGGARTVQRAF